MATTPEWTDIRFRTRGGAIVRVTQEGGGYPANCEGCHWSGIRYTILSPAREKASKHAAQCAALPPDEGVAT